MHAVWLSLVALSTFTHEFLLDTEQNKSPTAISEVHAPLSF
jgi:hypothetical protein